jgi:PHD/YefM family antitoxin component YafN of YafNO toxin-antitoxin module
MEIYTYSEARQNLVTVLEKAERSGKVLIRRRDGRVFALVPE